MKKKLVIIYVLSAFIGLHLGFFVWNTLETILPMEYYWALVGGSTLGAVWLFFAIKGGLKEKNVA